ncbi:MAG: hypothetical protein LC114_27635 [Bryobacterales bacterium]|nr:hypothetical protein [Bryobacterales bacterium]
MSGFTQKCQTCTTCGWKVRLCAAMLSLGLAVQPAYTQSAVAADPSPSQTAPTRLEIRILTPTPLSEPAGALSANRIAVQIVDGWGMPVSGATVSFRLPEAGPGGVFLNGLSTEIAIADREGRAAVQGFDWRAETGTSFLHVIAAYGGVRAGAMVELQLLPRTSSGRPMPEPAGARSTLPSAPQATRSAEAEYGRVILGRQADEASSDENRRNASVPDPTPPAPREIRASAPMENGSTASSASPAPYVTVSRKSGGGKTLLVIGIVAAAAGGALVAGMVRHGSSASQTGSANPNPAGIVIGSPSISVTGAGR